METIVKIKWDKPEEQNWLCADNISLALHAYCKNTKFEASEIETPTDEDIEAWAEKHSHFAVTKEARIEGAKAFRDGEITHIDNGK